MMHDLPPQAAGTAEQQILALRDYLVRLVRELDFAGEERAVSGKSASEAQKQTVKAVQDQAASLKALIIKNANEIIEQTDARFELFSGTYVAKSDFGNYYEQIDTQVQQTARATVESYHYTEAIDALDGYVTDLNGQIRRGLIEDPLTHEVHLGIAISENLSFTGQTQEKGGMTYYVLSPGQTLGLYTSTGWQFWIRGNLMGWFSSEDSMLHVANIVVENELQLGSDWQISTSGGFGLRFVGG